jgi:RsiW-degrading membrane proteinase PrsW (M82 family)
VGEQTQANLTPAPFRSATAIRTRRVGLTVVAIVVLGFAGLIVVRILAGELGSTGLWVGGAFAVLPVIPVTFALLWLDRWEPEPPGYLLAAFGWGATVAALIAVIVNTVFNLLFRAMYDGPTSDAITAIAVAPVVEELAKGAFVIGFWLLHRREFDGIIDGIVLAGFSALGFAFTENVLYFGRAFIDGIAASGAVEAGLVSSVGTFVVRGILSPFAHPLFTAMTGFGVAIAAASHRRGRRVVAVIAGLAVAIVLHATWNFSAALGEAFLFVYPVIMVPVFGLAVWLATWSRLREGHLLARHLPAYVAAGWLAPHEVRLLSSLPLRRRLTGDAARIGGVEMSRATREYHEAATELAFLRERILRGTAGDHGLQHQAELLRVLADRRSRAFVPPPPPYGYLPARLP